MAVAMTPINIVADYPTTGFRQQGDSISEAVSIVVACESNRRLTPEQIEAWQVLIDTNEAWRRGEAFSRRTKQLIDAGTLKLARRSYHKTKWRHV
jgi:hypothetical protein